MVNLSISALSWILATHPWPPATWQAALQVFLEQVVTACRNKGGKKDCPLNTGDQYSAASDH